MNNLSSGEQPAYWEIHLDPPPVTIIFERTQK